MRVLLTMMIAGVVLLPYLLLTPDQIPNIYWLMVCKSLLPTFIAGFLIFCGLLELLFIKIQLL